MTNRRHAFIGLALALAIFPLRIFATTVDAPDFDKLVDRADYVVRAVVKSVTSEWRENEGHRYIASKVELEIREVIKGTPPQPLVLEMVGGRVGDEELVIEGAPQFHSGDENIFFIRGNGRQFFPLVGVMHGLYPVFRDDKSGQDYVMRGDGKLLYSEKDVSLPMAGSSPVKQKNPNARPMTAAAFISKIRAHVPTSRPTSEK